jgi:hypothetical protein
MNRNLNFIIAGLASACTTAAYAQNWLPFQQTNSLPSAVPFLLTSPDARAAGMGETGVASSTDANSIHWNGAKLAFAEKKAAVSVSYTPWMRAVVPDQNFFYASGYYRLGEKSVIGASARLLSLGRITFYTSDGIPMAQMRPTEYGLDGCYAYRLNEHFSVSGTARFFHSNVVFGYFGTNGYEPINSFAADLGGLYKTQVNIADRLSTFSVGISLSNLGPKTDYGFNYRESFIPANLRIGSSLATQFSTTHQFGINLDINKMMVPSPGAYSFTEPSWAKGTFGSFSDAPDGISQEFSETGIAVGVEYSFKQKLIARGGFVSENGKWSPKQFFTFGAGVRIQNLTLDASYLLPVESGNPLANTVRVTAAFEFGKS